MTNWTTVSSLATAGGTLVLAVATFSAVRSANRSARIAERSFEIGLRPILAPSRLEDPPQKVMFHDRHWVVLEGGRAVVEVVDGVVYLAMLVRNVGSGMAIIESWEPFPGQRSVQRPLGGHRGLPTADQGPVDRSRRCRLLAGGAARRDMTRCRRPWPQLWPRARSPWTCSTSTTKVGSGP